MCCGHHLYVLHNIYLEEWKRRTKLAAEVAKSATEIDHRSKGRLDFETVSGCFFQDCRSAYMNFGSIRINESFINYLRTKRTWNLFPFVIRLCLNEMNLSLGLYLLFEYWCTLLLFRDVCSSNDDSNISPLPSDNKAVFRCFAKKKIAMEFC